MSTASDQYFLNYVKKTTGGGQIDPPPPAGIGLRKVLLKHKEWFYRNIKKGFTET